MGAGSSAGVGGPEGLSVGPMQSAERAPTEDAGRRANEELQRLLEASEKARLEQELAAATAEHRHRIEIQRGELYDEHSEMLQVRIKLQEAEAELVLRDAKDDNVAMHSSLLLSVAAQDQHLYKEELRQQANRHASMVSVESELMMRWREELVEARMEERGSALLRDSETQAAGLAMEEISAERVSDQSEVEMKLAHISNSKSEMEALDLSQRSLDEMTHKLQLELGSMTYAVGQRDQELHARNSELQEVRQQLATFHGDMDHLNSSLRAQCGRVEQAEASLRLSSDLGDRVGAMRDMVRESHGVLGQLCSLLEEERAKGKVSTEGLKQQRVRTELLLQLLQHFKGRAEDLAPQMILGQQSNPEETVELPLTLPPAASALYVDTLGAAGGSAKHDGAHTCGHAALGTPGAAGASAEHKGGPTSGQAGLYTPRVAGASAEHDGAHTRGHASLGTLDMPSANAGNFGAPAFAHAGWGIQGVASVSAVNVGAYAGPHNCWGRTPNVGGASGEVVGAFTGAHAGWGTAGVANRGAEHLGLYPCAYSGMAPMPLPPLPLGLTPPQGLMGFGTFAGGT